MCLACPRIPSAPTRTAAICLCVLALASHTSGNEIYRCPDDSGTPSFSAQPCDDQASPIVLPEIGSLPGMRDIPQIETAPPTPLNRRESAGGLSFSERNRLREIEIRLTGLRRDLHGGGRQRQQEIRTEIRQLEKEQRVLQAKASRGYAGP